MTGIRKIQLDCRKATALIEKKAFTPLTRKEKMHLFIHLLGCSICRRFRRQSRWINQLLRSQTFPARLSEEFKNQLQEKINQRSR